MKLATLKLKTAQMPILAVEVKSATHILKDLLALNIGKASLLKAQSFLRLGTPGVLEILGDEKYGDLDLVISDAMPKAIVDKPSFRYALTDCMETSDETIESFILTVGRDGVGRAWDSKAGLTDVLRCHQKVLALVEALRTTPLSIESPPAEFPIMYLNINLIYEISDELLPEEQVLIDVIKKDYRILSTYESAYKGLSWGLSEILYRLGAPVELAYRFLVKTSSMYSNPRGCSLKKFMRDLQEIDD